MHLNVLEVTSWLNRIGICILDAATTYVEFELKCVEGNTKGQGSYKG